MQIIISIIKGLFKLLVLLIVVVLFIVTLPIILLEKMGNYNSDSVIYNRIESWFENIINK